MARTHENNAFSSFQTADAKRTNLFDNIVSKPAEELEKASEKARQAIRDADHATATAASKMEAFTAENTAAAKDEAIIAWETALEKAKAAVKAVEIAYEYTALQMAGNDD